MRLRIALQKQGRLAESSSELLKKCGIRFSNGKNGQLRSEAVGFPLDIFYLRDDDIPDYVADDVADAGIVGENILAEEPLDVEVVEKLGFGRCRLSLAVQKNADYDGLADFDSKRIATSYPNILQRFLQENGISAEIHEITGSVEIAPSIGLADAICDLVSSGSTLFSNGLKEVHTVLNSQAVLIGRRDLDEGKRRLLDDLLFRVRSVGAASENKYILLNAPAQKVDEISRLLPGMRAPSLVPLAEPGWVSMHSVISEHDFWDVVDKLKQTGAEGILVLAIDQMIR